jgi:hypothetical protein
MDAKKVIRLLRDRLRRLEEDYERADVERVRAQALVVELVERFGEGKPPSRRSVRAAVRFKEDGIEVGMEVEDDDEGRGSSG